jgi:hypothetical protein
MQDATARKGPLPLQFHRHHVAGNGARYEYHHTIVACHAIATGRDALDGHRCGITHV